jgi:hypothetical protein
MTLEAIAEVTIWFVINMTIVTATLLSLSATARIIV